jgi:hypothetical protein
MTELPHLTIPYLIPFTCSWIEFVLKTTLWYTPPPPLHALYRDFLMLTLVPTDGRRADALPDWWPDVHRPALLTQLLQGGIFYLWAAVVFDIWILIVCQLFQVTTSFPIIPEYSIILFCYLCTDRLGIRWKPRPVIECIIRIRFIPKNGIRIRFISKSRIQGWPVCS